MTTEPTRKNTAGLGSLSAAGLVAALALAGCSGGGEPGGDEYVLRDGSTMRVLTVDGVDMIAETMDCGEERDEDRSEGKMNESRTYVSWHVEDGVYSADDDIEFSADDETLTFATSRGTKVYFQDGTDLAQVEWDEWTERCAE
ncbi:hypothetical protein LO763_13890 [Glycomyces sp. A-F 0318]|uniref:hypothetical protein n=1 Tax=Glycomyces amatae TaxID=2881355 RepID=UPI001E44C79C|nr:hypothetical protein [Glycomyces amatae]MCD0444710.1 hypothetical protein [Glycomyces amatae]